MRTSLYLLLAVLITLSTGGCGTVCNLAGGVIHPDSEPRVYGGFIRDIEIIDSVVSHPSPQRESFQGMEGRGAALLVGAILSVAAVDPILSLVADTLTLPVTIPLQEKRIGRQRDNAALDPASLPTGTERAEPSPSGESGTAPPPSE
jgi:uncharacterized protein YceK